MFPDAGRLLRTDWSKLSLSNLRGKSPDQIDNASLVAAAEEIGQAVDRLAEEIASLMRGNQPLKHEGRLVLETTQLPGSEQGTLEATNLGALMDGYAAIFRGRVKFIPPLDLGSGGGAAMIGWARATSNWVNVPDNDSYVDCKITTDRTDSVSNLGDLRVYLPRTAQRDPNVRSGNIIGYLLDANDEATCVTDYLDDKIDTVKGWTQPEAIPPGWELTYQGLMIFGYEEGSDEFGEIGFIGGNMTHTHADHDASDIAPHSGFSTLPDGGSSITPSGSTGPATSTGTTGSGGGAVTAEGGEAGEVETGIQSDNPTIVVPEDYVISSAVSVNDPGHSHTVSDSQQAGQTPPIVPRRGSPTSTSSTGMQFKGLNANEFFSTTSFNVAIWQPDVFEGVTLEGDHTHTVNASDIASRISVGTHSHSVSMSAHSHAISGSGLVAPHTHTIPDMSHSGTITHSEENHLPPYVVVCWIKRVN